MRMHVCARFFVTIISLWLFLLPSIEFLSDKYLSILSNNRYGSVDLQLIKTLLNTEQYRIVIEKLQIDAPVLVNIDTSNETEYISALKEGVALAKYSSLPGENGVSVIFAHSSSLLTDLGKYARIFKHINDLSIGDVIVIESKNKSYTYFVYDIKIVDDKEIDLTSYDNTISRLILVTCDPPGTFINRRMVFAKLI